MATKAKLYESGKTVVTTAQGKVSVEQRLGYTFVYVSNICKDGDRCVGVTLWDDSIHVCGNFVRVPDHDPN